MAPATEDDVARWRAETPGVSHRIHLNNAGASLEPQVVLDAVHDHLRLEGEIGGYEAAAAAAGSLARVYVDIGALVGAAAQNVAIVSSATAAVQQALSAFDFAPGDTILTSSADYVSQQLMLRSLVKRRGVRIVYADDLPEGGVDPESVARLIVRERPALVSLTWIPTNSGLIQMAADVGAACERAGVPFLLDACQALGQMPVDIARLKCTYLATTARKFLRGPRGIGALVVSDAVLAGEAHPLLVDMRGAAWTDVDEYSLFPGARRFEQWELPHALVLGFGAAARYAADAGVDRCAHRAHALAAFARARLRAIPGVRSLDHAARLCAIASFAIEGRDGQQVMLALRDRFINTSAQSRGDALIDFDRKGATSSLRVSPHYFNTEAEIVRLDEALREVLAQR